MEKISMTLTVYFENGFWYGLFERHYAKSYSVCRICFGKEPTNQEVLLFLNQKYHQLCFSPSLYKVEKAKPANPKRLQRLARKEQGRSAYSSKSQEALKKQFDAQKFEKRSKDRRRNALAKQRKFELKQQKRLEKHKGH